MDFIEFVKLVRKLRSAQKAYFKNRLQIDLINSKQLEAAVDKALDNGIILRKTHTLEEEANALPE